MSAFCVKVLVRASPISFSFMYREAQSICRYPIRNAVRTPFPVTLGSANHVLDKFEEKKDYIVEPLSTRQFSLLTCSRVKKV